MNSLIQRINGSIGELIRAGETVDLCCITKVKGIKC